jgi:hypothetical protein
MQAREPGGHHLEDCLWVTSRGEWALAREHFIDDQSERVYVRACVGILSSDLFGAHVGRRSHYGQGFTLGIDETCDAKIYYLQNAVVGFPA